MKMLLPKSARAASAAAMLLCPALCTQGQTWNLPAGGTWNDTASWTPATIPNAVGASVTFNNAASGSNPAQTGNRTATLDAAITVGAITFNIDGANAFTTTIANGTGGSLTFDQTGSGPATINIPAATGTGNVTVSAGVTLTDSLELTTDDTTQTSTAGALTFTGTITGPGGFTKKGLGLATFGTAAKTYSGPTVLDGGRMRISQAARPQNTSSFTITTSGQLELITAGTYDLGAGIVYLNGAGPTTGPFAPFPGAIRPTTAIVATINNAVVLQSDTVLHMQGTAGSLTMAGNISGPGKLIYTSIPHDANLGALVLLGANTYTGGTVVNGGTLLLNANLATLGTGDVTVQSASASFGGASAKITIGVGVMNAIDDNATLSLAGGNAAGVADDGYIDLAAGVNEVVGKLVLGGVPQLPGTYGSTASTAAVQNDEYFAGTGILTVRPSLNITLSAPNVIVSWPTNAGPTYTLQGIGAFGDTWMDDPVLPVISDTNYTVTELAPTNKFFRLKQ